MNKNIFTLFAVLGLLISCSQTHTNPFDRLDNAIELQEYYDLMFTRQTDSIALLYQQADYLPLSQLQSPAVDAQ